MPPIAMNIDTAGLTLYTYRATVESIHDGDTVTIAIDLGFGITYRLERVRLAGINAPELATTAGPPSRDHLTTLIGALPASVAVVTFKDRADNYGRYLVRIIRPDGMDINQQMITDGFAVALGPLPA